MSEANAKPGDVYRKAAKRIASGQSWVSCWAICVAAHRDYSDMDKDVLRYAALFKPPNSLSLWFGRSDSPINQNHRILALCFMAAITDAGDA